MFERIGRSWGVALAVAAVGCAGAPAGEAESQAALGSAVVLASGQPQPFEVAVDETYVYFVDSGTAQDDGSVRRVAKTGGAVEILAAHEAVPQGLVVDDSTVYWTAGGNGAAGTVRAWSKTTKKVSSLVGDLKEARALTADAYNLYFYDDGFMYRLSKLGGLPVPVAAATCVVTSANDFASVYWVENCVLFPPEGIFAAAKTGSLPVAFSIDAPGALFVDSSNVYWVAGSQVKSQWKLGGLPSVVYDTGKDNYGTIEAMDASALYLQVGESLVRVPKSGGRAATVWQGDFAPNGAAVDGKNVYFAGSDAIYAVAKK